MFAQADYSPSSSPEAISRVNSFINRAYNQLALEAPFLFFETELTMAVEPDVSSGAGTDALNDRIKLAGTNTLPRSPSGNDPWTWKTTYTATQAATASNNLTVWKYDRSWDGRIIEITAEDGTLVRNQIRSVWLESDIYHMTFVRPWDTTAYPDTNYDGFTYKILTESYPLPDNMIELKSARLRDKSNNFPLDVIGQQQAEQLQLISPSTNVTSGIPRSIFRRGHMRLQGPAVPPVVTLADSSVTSDGSLEHEWLGPEPPGSFQYKVTYTWGKRDSEFQLPGLGHWEGMASGYLNTGQNFPGSVEDETDANGSLASRNRYREPWIESPASPESNVVELTPVDEQGGSAYPAVRISLPNIEYALGFLNTVVSGGSTYTRQSMMQSGIYIRIYRKRLTTDFDGYRTGTNVVQNLFRSQLDAAEDYYLLAETRITEGTWAKGWFFDNGEIIPDYNRRLRDIHGYQTIAFYPRPDQRYPVSLRCIVRPQELADDDDTPLIHAEAMDILIERAMSFFYESLGNAQLSVASRAKYQAELQTLSNRYGDLRPASVPVLRRMSRVRSSARTNRKWNKRLTDSDLGWET